jgi:hypothetical protein
MTDVSWARALTTAVLAFALSSAVAPAFAQNMPSEELERRTMQRRAVEAVLWGMPAVAYDLMLQEMLGKTAGKVNQVIYWGRPLDWKNQTLTPNPDAILFMSFFSLADGPVVIEVPPADAGGSLDATLVDLWQRPLAELGRRGIDRGKGTRLIIRSSGSAQEYPVGKGVVSVDTYSGYVLFRSTMASRSEADVAKAVAYGKRIKIYPWSQSDDPPATFFTDVKDVLFDATIRYDESFFVHLARIVRRGWLDRRDYIMIDHLRSLGIEYGKPFSPDAATKQPLADGIREAHAWLEAKYDAGLEPFFYDTHWSLPVPPELIPPAPELIPAAITYANPPNYPIDARALASHYTYLGILRLGGGQFWLINIKDKNGESYDGSRTYRLQIPPDAPIDQWSLTAYDRDTHAPIKNVGRASRASNAADLKKAADGSVDLYIGPKAPPGQETNWIPTDPKRRFELMFRVYGPQRAFFAKKWPLPDVEKID